MTEPKFMTPAHRRAYLTHLNRCKAMDSYHRALIYILTAVPALRNNIFTQANSWILSGLKSWGICCCISTQQKTPLRRTKSLLLRMNCVLNYSTKLQRMFFKKLRENTFILMQMMTRLQRFADVGSLTSTCFLSIGVHAEHFTQQNK